MRYLRTHRDLRRARRGSIIVLSAIMLIVFMAILALSVDLGYLYTMQTRLDRSVDAAALAGTSSLIDGQVATKDMVVEYLARNPLDDSANITTQVEVTTLKSQWMAEHEEELELTYGYWNPETRQLESALDPSAVRVVVARADVPLFFARALGFDHASIVASSVATYQPRDIVLVLDLSASMNDDSELKSLGTLGRESVEGDLAQIYYELGSPHYGNLTFAPRYATVAGLPPQDETLPQITVEYRGNSVQVTSTKDISSVQAQLIDGSVCCTDMFPAGTLETTMNYPQVVQRLYVAAGSNTTFFPETSGQGELFNFADNVALIEAMGLSGVAYPYPAGSWNDYVTHVRASGNANAGAGYRCQFGYLNLVNYWLERQPASHQTPDLWKGSAQPLATVKDAVTLFTDYVQEVNTKDRIGLVVYNSSSGEGTVEVPLTFDLDQAPAVARQRQAGHYHSATNVGGGLAAASNELLEHGRDGAFKMIVLLTDGAANYAFGATDPAAACDYTLAEAARAYQLKYKVMTISLGLGADTTLMQQVANMADGIHFSVPGGQTIAETEAGLVEAFREIARKRPVMLVE